MSTNPFGLVVIGLSFLCLCLPYRFTLYMLVSLTAFGTAAAINLPALGGGTILVATFFIFCAFTKAFLDHGPDAIFRSFMPPSIGVWFVALMSYAVLSCFLFPRLFAGEIATMSLSRPSAGAFASVGPTPLSFTSGNINQGIYVIGGIITFCSTFTLLGKPDAPRHLLNAIVISCIVNIVLALADLASFTVGMGWLLDFIRTASYSMLTGATLGGIKRIAGGFAEASAFATYTLIQFAIMASLWLDGIRPKLTGPLAAVLLVLLLLATSTTAYVALVMVGAVYALHTVVRLLMGQPIRRPVAMIAIAVVLTGLISLLILFLPQALVAAYNLIDEAVLQKGSSSSAEERGSWNAYAWGNFIDTMGLGVGVGSVRTSSYVMALLSNIGVVGTLLFVIFYGSLFFLRLRTDPAGGRNTPEWYERRALLAAIRSGVLAGIAAMVLVGTTFDLGVLIYILAGAGSALLYQQARGFEASVAARPFVVSHHRGGG